MARSQSEPASGVCVLIVEDDDDSRDMLSELIGSLGHRALGVANAREALECTQANPWNVALIDIGLPDVDGYEVARRLRVATAQDPSRRLVALTGFSDGAARAAAQAAGFDEFLVKPVFPEKLAQVLQLRAL